MHHSRTIEEGIAQLARELEAAEGTVANGAAGNEKQPLQLAGVAAS
jgi:hypothetical protein